MYKIIFFLGLNLAQPTNIKNFLFIMKIISYILEYTWLTTKLNLYFYYSLVTGIKTLKLIISLDFNKLLYFSIEHY